jgi:hypothetical protein
LAGAARIEVFTLARSLPRGFFGIQTTTV